MPVGSPDPRYYKDGNGLKPTWRLWLRHPRWAAWLSAPRWYVRWKNGRRDRSHVSNQDTRDS